MPDQFTTEWMDNPPTADDVTEAMAILIALALTNGDSVSAIVADLVMRAFDILQNDHTPDEVLDAIRAQASS